MIIYVNFKLPNAPYHGRATHQPTSNGGENIACRNKSLIQGVNNALSNPANKYITATLTPHKHSDFCRN